MIVKNTDIDLPLYGDFDEPYVQIDRLIKYCELKHPEKKIKKYSKKIRYYFAKNQYGGYIPIRFIKMMTAYDIMFTCKSTKTTEKFKKIICGIAKEASIS